MKNSETTLENTFYVKEISQESFISFLSNNEKSVVSHKNLYFGLFLKNKIVGVCHFGKPITQTKKKEYSYQLFSVNFLETTNNKNGLSKVVEHFVKTINPEDFFFYQKNELLPDKVLLKSNMNLIKVEKSRKTWEWVNPKNTYYAYKITSEDSPKFYIGISHIKKENGTVDDCLNDDYYGSGGVKFKNWVKKHPNLKKEILKLFPSRRLALSFEKRTLNKYLKKDKNCLNSAAGGERFINNTKTYSKNSCAIHGWTTFRFEECNKCLMADKVIIKKCPVHGETKHWKQKDTCFKCEAKKIFSTDNCKVHGMTVFRGKTCARCGTLSSINEKECPIHGITTHWGKTCQICKNQSLVEIKECSTHGITKHTGMSCAKCYGDNTITMLDCYIHGRTKHRGKACCKCSKAKDIKTQGTCSIHGTTVFNDKECFKCSISKSIVVQKCPVHGETKHRAGNCYKCQAVKVYSVKPCSIHGEKTHRGNTCLTCVGNKTK